MKQYFTNTEIDEILVGVDDAIKEAGLLAKSETNENLKKFGEEDQMMGQEDDAPSMEGAPAAEEDASFADQAPVGEEDASMAAMGQDDGMGMDQGMEGDQGMGDEMGMDQGMGMEGEEALSQEGEGQEISDEELHEIYESMEDQELERHYMVIRSLLQGAYQKAEMAKTSMREGQQSYQKSEQESEGEEMAKAERKQITALEKSNDELKGQLTKALKAIQLFAKPQRKSVASNIEFVAKSEGQEPTAGSKEAMSSLSKTELGAKINKVVKSNTLNKSERNTINTYLLNGGRDEDKMPVLEILEGK
jgi:hypothetical protein